MCHKKTDTAFFGAENFLSKFCSEYEVLNPKISVIIPAYNVEKYIEKCLLSVNLQTLKEIEIIVINDGSTDSTLSLILEFAKVDKRIKVINQENKKQGAARNEGLKIAKGEYIGYIDADDWIDIDYFEKLYFAAKKHDADIALANNIRVGGKKKKARLNIDKEEAYSTLQEKFDICKQWKNQCPTNKIYKREMLEKNKITWPEDIYCEDKIYTTKAIYYANKIVAVPNIFYYYYRNPNSTVLGGNKKQLRKHKNIAKMSVIEFLRENNAKLKDKEFFAIKKEFSLLKIPILQIKESIYTRIITIFGIPFFEKEIKDEWKNFERQKIKIFGIKILYKNKDFMKKANHWNIEQNKINLNKNFQKNEKNILFVARNFIKKGGIETRLNQYIEQIIPMDWKIFILSENNQNEELLKYTNFNLIFDAKNIEECLIEIINKYKINVIEFQFKSPKILKNIDLSRLKLRVKTGCTIHNLGIKNYKILNEFDYKIIASEYMYKNNYKKVIGADVIQNCIDIKKFENFQTWEYEGQKTALFISRIAVDKLNSIECFIKYCIQCNYNFLIAGGGFNFEEIKKNLIKKYSLKEENFIGEINTMEYLSKNRDKILFVGGLGQVIIEGLFLNFPCLCCSNYKGEKFSFVTNKNFFLFDNFTVNKNLENKKEFELKIDDIKNYKLRHLIIANRNLTVSIGKYLGIIENN